MAKKLAEIEAPILLTIEGAEEVKKQIAEINKGFKSAQNGANIEYTLTVDSKGLVQIQKLQKDLQKSGKDLLKIGIDKAYFEKAFAGIKGVGSNEINKIQQFFNNALNNVGDDGLQETCEDVVELVEKIKILKNELLELQILKDGGLSQFASYKVNNYYGKELNSKEALKALEEAKVALAGFEDYYEGLDISDKQRKDIFKNFNVQVKINGKDAKYGFNDLKDELDDALLALEPEDEYDIAYKQIELQSEELLDKYDQLPRLIEDKNGQLQKELEKRQQLFEQIQNTVLPEEIDQSSTLMDSKNIKESQDGVLILEKFKAEVAQIQQQLQNLGEIPIKIIPANIGDFIEKIEKHKAHIQLEVTNIDEVVKGLNTAHYRGVYDEVYNAIQGKRPDGRKITNSTSKDDNIAAITKKILDIYKKNAGADFNPTQLAELVALMKRNTELNLKENKKRISDIPSLEEKYKRFDIFQDKLEEFGYNVGAVNRALSEMGASFGLRFETTFDNDQEVARQKAAAKYKERQERYQIANQSYKQYTGEGVVEEKVVNAIQNLVKDITSKDRDLKVANDKEVSSLVGLSNALQKLSGKNVDLDAIVKSVSATRSLQDITYRYDVFNKEFLEEQALREAERKAQKKRSADKKKQEQLEKETVTKTQNLQDKDRNNDHELENLDLAAKLNIKSEEISALKSKIENDINPLDVKLNDKIDTSKLTTSLKNIPVDLKPNVEKLQQDVAGIKLKPIPIQLQVNNQEDLQQGVNEQLGNQSVDSFSKSVKSLKANLKGIQTEFINISGVIDTESVKQIVSINNINNAVDKLKTDLSTLKVGSLDFTNFKNGKIPVSLNINKQSLNEDIRKLTPAKVQVGLKPMITQFRKDVKAITLAPKSIVLKPNINELKKSLKTQEGLFVNIEAKLANVKELKENLKDVKGLSANIDLAPNIEQLQGKLDKIETLRVGVLLKPNILQLQKELNKIDDLTISFNNDDVESEEEPKKKADKKKKTNSKQDKKDKTYSISLTQQANLNKKVQNALNSINIDNLLDKKINFVDDDELRDIQEFSLQVDSILSKIEELNERLTTSFKTQKDKEQAIIDLNKQLDLLNEINSVENQLSNSHKKTIETIPLKQANPSEEELSNTTLKVLQRKYDSVKLGQFNNETKSWDKSVLRLGETVYKGTIHFNEYTNAANEAAAAIELVKFKSEAYTSSGKQWADGFKRKFHSLTQYVTGIELVMRAVNEIRQGFTFVQELDKRLVTINQTMDVTQSELKSLSNGAIDMAKNLKTSAQNVLDAVAIYANATETTESILAKAEPTIMLANASGVDASIASDQIQGVWIRPLHAVMRV